MSKAKKVTIAVAVVIIGLLAYGLKDANLFALAGFAATCFTVGVLVGAKNPESVEKIKEKNKFLG